MTGHALAKGLNRVTGIGFLVKMSPVGWDKCAGWDDAVLGNCLMPLQLGIAFPNFRVKRRRL